MSTRIRTDGRRYNPETDLPVRPFHKPVEPDKPPFWKCAVCGSDWGWVTSARTKDGGSFRRHYPGTFWEQD